MGNTEKMKVEIWSDIACPFCHIGKRNFESALAQFPNSDNVEIEWKSFQLDPNAEVNQQGLQVEKLARKYGVSVDEAKKMNSRVTGMARESGLNFNLDNVKPTNTFDAHRLLHLAKKHGLQEQAEERLFEAYLSEGKHIGEAETLIQLGREIGLDAGEVSQLLNSDDYADAVKEEIRQAQRLGISGVPFFVIDNKYGISGAQPREQFLKTLDDIWSREHGLINIESTSGGVCSPDGNCS
jgi:predicted DsbA family dithiol-disulfide isomerase